ncbi:MAG: EAL domain-containing protein [Gammaproteobacteria bacterium]|nr:EAL domain-containing protein [Gammaproteobacteria bacterium]
MVAAAGAVQLAPSGVVLVMAASEEPAKRIESRLRNSGHPLRSAWVSDLEELGDVLARQQPDLLITEVQIGRVTAKQVLELCARRCPQLPVLLLGMHSGAEAAGAALAAGAHDLVALDDESLGHLEAVVLREVTAYRQARELTVARSQLLDYRSRHQQLTERSTDAIAHVREGIVVSANATFARLLRAKSPDDLAGVPLIDLVEADQQTKVKERLRAVLKGKYNGEPLELALRSGSGRIDVKAKLVLGSIDGEQTIELLVRDEPAPGRGALPLLGGRAAFARAIGTPAPASQTRAAIMLRIDEFADLESRIGPIDAQEVFQRVVEAVRAQLQPADLSFPFSTDELALLIRRGSFSDIEGFGEQLRGHLSGQIYATRRHEAQVRVSVVVYPLAAQENPEAVVGELMAAVRELSQKGGDRATLLGAAASARLAERDEVNMAAMIRKALEQNRLKLAYQSIASLEGGPRALFDVLIRLVDDTTHREYHASEFLPTAQKHGLLIEIDRWVVSRALQILAKHGDERLLFVKLSEDTLKQAEAFIAWLKAQIGQRKLASNELVFELQELMLQNHLRKTSALTRALTELGAGMAIERFGSGTHSAQLIEHLPVKYVKFDPSFTRDFAESASNKKLAELIQLAAQRKIKTIVSHVEDAGAMAQLWQMGVNYVQGYHVQEPEVVMLVGEVRRR